MGPKRWFLPELPDVVGLLRAQIAATIDGLEHFAEWATGDEAAGERLQEIEHRGDERKRELLQALRDAFITPLEPEDAFALSRAIDWVLNFAADLIEEANALATVPDARIAEMATLLVEAMRDIDRAVAHLVESGDEAMLFADSAIRTEQRLERTYLRGMAALLEEPVERERIARRELYRRCFRIGEVVIDIAERVIYAIVKES